MPNYIATIKNDDNKKEKIEFEAQNINDAERIALVKSKVVYKIKESNKYMNFYSNLTSKERILFFNTLSSLSYSLSFTKALELIYEEFNGNIKRVALSLKQKIELGFEVQEAFSQMRDKDFPPVIVAMLNAGLSSGKISDALKNAANFEKEMSTIEKDSKKGIIVHMMGFLFSCFVIMLCKYWFLPEIYEKKLSKLIKNFDMSIINGFTDFVISSIFFFLFLFLFLSSIEIIKKIFSPVIIDKFISMIPIYGKFSLYKNNYVTLYQLSKLIERNLKLEDSLEKTTTNMKKGLLRNDFLNSISLLKEGRKWVDGLSTFSKIDKASLNSSVDNEKASIILADLSNNYKEKYMEAIDRINIFFYWFTIIYLSLSVIILFLYTSVPIMSSAQQSFGSI